MNLTAEQVEALKQGEPIRLLYPEVGRECVVLLAERYERVKHVLGYDDSDLSEEERTALAWEAGKSIGWDTPEMAEYDDYDTHLKQP